jgi:hypothetical protein
VAEAGKVEAKISENWRRPKGMHRATHERLLSIIWDCEERRDAALATPLAALMRQDPLLRNAA